MDKTLKLNVFGQNITLEKDVMLVAGTLNEYTAEFSFDSYWDGYQKFAVFSCEGVTREEILTNDMCIIPWEVLISGYIRIGVYGITGSNRLPTVWTERGLFIHPGAGPTQEAADPSPTLVEQLLGRIGDPANLKTDDKSSLIAAINEIKETGSSGYATKDKAGTIKIGDNLTISEDGVLSVDTTNNAEQDNTKPMTSAGVYTLAGNIEVLLAAL